MIRLVEALVDGDAELAEALLDELDDAPDASRCSRCRRWPGQAWECTPCTQAELDLQVAAA
jgi:hypothetical protein